MERNLDKLKERSLKIVMSLKRFWMVPGMFSGEIWKKLQQKFKYPEDSREKFLDNIMRKFLYVS